MTTKPEIKYNAHWIYKCTLIVLTGSITALLFQELKLKYRRIKIWFDTIGFSTIGFGTIWFRTI